LGVIDFFSRLLHAPQHSAHGALADPSACLLRKPISEFLLRQVALGLDPGINAGKILLADGGQRAIAAWGGIDRSGGPF